ncbi:MAG TPA: hypothetical protein PKN12_01305 [Bacteroidales bacterium]|nr:hypothetical protein [Bacteroidales bacterium]HPT09496.1 hypothetical protein [Bacteroidales bacterium]
MKLLHQGFLVLIVMFSACSRAPRSEALIMGKLAMSKSTQLLLSELEPKSVRRIDSIVPGVSGDFQFRIPLTEPGFFMLHAPSGKVLVLMLHPGDTVCLSGSFEEFPDHVRVAGPEETMWLDGFFRSTRLREKKADSLELILVEKQDSSGFYEWTRKLDTVFKAIWEEQRAEEIQFVQKHTSSLASLIVLNYAFGLNTVLNPSDDKLWFEKLDSALNLRYPANKHVRYHHERVKGMAAVP